MLPYQGECRKFGTDSDNDNDNNRDIDSDNENDNNNRYITNDKDIMSNVW